MKKIIFGIVIGIILGSGIVYAINYSAKDISYTKNDCIQTTVQDSLDELYNIDSELSNLKNIGNAEASDIANGKTALVNGQEITGTLKKGGYVALFDSSSSITTSTSNVTLKYFDESFGIKGNNAITLNIPGNYRIIGTVAHSPFNSSCTSHLRLYINGSNPNTAGNNHVNYWTINKALTINENETYTIKATMDSDCNLDGLRGGTMVVIKES